MSRIDELIEQMHGLEQELQVEFDKKRDDFRVVLEDRRVRFSEEITQIERAATTRLGHSLSIGSVFGWLASPVIYAGIVPLALLDGFIVLYQAVCFPAYRIPKVRRSDYIMLDRGDLPYLNALEQLNCVYCGYANGLAAYFREVAARTEQYWCPIKHARRIIAAHDRYPTFFEYGDAESYRLGLERLRYSIADAERRTGGGQR